MFLRLSDYLVDLYTEAVDVAVRMDTLPDRLLIVPQDRRNRARACASPEYIARRGAEIDRRSGKAQLSDVAISRLTTVPVGCSAAVAPCPCRCRVALDADAGDVLTQWALNGEGIAMKPVSRSRTSSRMGALGARSCREPADLSRWPSCMLTSAWSRRKSAPSQTCLPKRRAAISRRRWRSRSRPAGGAWTPARLNNARNGHLPGRDAGSFKDFECPPIWRC